MRARASLEQLGLTLRPPLPGDAAALARFTHANFERLRPWLPLPPRDAIDAWAPRAIAESERGRRAGTELRLMLFGVRDEPKVHGHVMLTRIDRGAEPASMLSYAVDQALEGTGVMLAAVTLVVERALGPLRIPSIAARYHRDNARSARLLDQLGFSPDEAIANHSWLQDAPDCRLAVRRANFASVG